MKQIDGRKIKNTVFELLKGDSETLEGGGNNAPIKQITPNALIPKAPPPIQPVSTIFKPAPPPLKTNANDIVGVESAPNWVKTVIIVVVVLIIVIGVIIGIYKGMEPQMKAYMVKKKAKFPDERCTDSMTYQFPNLFGPPGMTFAINKAFCDANAQNEANKKNMGPMQSQLDKQNQMMNKMNQQMSNTQKMIFHIREGVMKQVRDMQQKLHNLYKRLAYVYKTFARLFYRIFVVFKSIFLTIRYAVWTLQTVWNGPIGKFFRFMCFGEETLLKIKRNGETKIEKISDIQIGDTICEDTIIGTCKLANYEDNEIYNLNGVYVSWSHLVEYNGELIRVHNHPDSIRVKRDDEIIYSLITNTGKLIINNTIFTDYQGDNTIETYNKIVKPLIGFEIIDKFFDIDMERYKNSAINLYPGFTCNSILRTNRGFITAEEIDIGDVIGGKKVIGVIKYRLEGKTFITNYANDEGLKGMFVGIQIFHKNKKYVTVKQEERWILGKLECIGILIEDSIIKIGNMEITDFQIINKENLYDIENEMCAI